MIKLLVILFIIPKNMVSYVSIRFLILLASHEKDTNKLPHGIYDRFDLWAFIYRPWWITLREKRPFWEFSGPYFAYSVKMRENTDQKNSKYRHFPGIERNSQPTTQLTKYMKFCESLSQERLSTSTKIWNKIC